MLRPRLGLTERLPSDALCSAGVSLVDGSAPDRGETFPVNNTQSWGMHAGVCLGIAAQEGEGTSRQGASGLAHVPRSDICHLEALCSLVQYWVMASKTHRPQDMTTFGMFFQI